MIRKFFFICFILNSNYYLNIESVSVNRTSAPYNTIVGYASSTVEAYSNGNDSFISDSDSYLYGVFMGIKWQCVEYARRWLFKRKGCVFASIDSAADMWTQLDSVQRVQDKKCFAFRKYSNGSPYRPMNESLLIYNRSGTAVPYGHVAVIVDVLSDVIHIAEENWYTYYWTGNYSRELSYELVNGNYFIRDDYPILGWMVVDDQNQTKPLDQTSIDMILKLNGSSPDFNCQNNNGYHHDVFVTLLYLCSFYSFFSNQYSSIN